MDIILLKDVENLGVTDDIVTVKPGYARNFLIPQKMAVVANDSNRRQHAGRMRYRLKQEEAMLSRIQEVKEQLTTAQIKIGAKVGTTDKIFGSVTTHHLSEEIKKQLSLDIDRRKITIIEGDVKTLGTYNANINLHTDHQVNLSFEVVAE